MIPYIHIILPSYSVMAFIGGFIAIIFLYFRLERYGVKFTTFLILSVLCAASGFVGSKLLFMITQIPILLEGFSLEKVVLVFLQSGYVYYGGLFGVITMVMLATRADFERRKSVLRLMSPAIPLFHGFGRIGCFLAGCCYGKKLDTPFPLFGVLMIDRIPVQLMESVYEFCMFAILLIIEKKPKEYNLLKVYLLGYAGFRFVIEFFRGDEVRGFFMGVSTAQWISMAIIFYYLVKMLHLRFNSKNEEKGMHLRYMQ